MKELVSCVIPSYKRVKTLRRAIDSVLVQTYSNVEVLVVDDNIQGDKYSEILHKIINEYRYDGRVRLVNQAKHMNGAEARNAGIRAAKGEWVAFLDDDDEWLPTKIEKQISFLKQRNDLKGCSVLYNEYSSGNLVHSCPLYTEDNLFLKIFRREVAVFTSTIMLKRECLIEIGMFDNKLIRHQDIQMILRFTDRFKIGVVSEYLVRLHIDSTINRPNADAIIRIKDDFFKSVNDLYCKCNKKDKQLIKSAHCYEIMFAALKQKKILIAIKYFFKPGIRLSFYQLLYKRIKDRYFVTQ